MRLHLLLLLSALRASTLKFLAYNPGIGTSHITFISRAAEALVEAGHEVVILAPVISREVKVPETKGARIITDIMSYSEEESERADLVIRKAHDLVWGFTSATDFAEIFDSLNRATAARCNATLHTPGLLERLREEKFDAAFAEPMDLCGFGIFNLIGIKSYLMMLSVSSTDATFGITGAPTVPSYVPGMMADFGDRMTFLQRVMNMLSLGIAYHIQESISTLYQGVFDELYPGMSQFYNIMVNSSLIFPNCEPLTDFPRPTSHKIVEIGGITVNSGDDVIDEKWNIILALRSKTVLFSFGSVAQAHRMPAEYKKAIREMVAELPEVTFIVKYEKPEDGFSKDLPNMVEAAWMPQRALLRDARLSAFVTHGGAGSSTEGTHAGVPLIVIPIMGDQVRNAQLIERLGTGIKLAKDILAKSSELIDAVKRILEDKSFTDKARLVASQLREAPFSPREKLVRNMEFMAKYGPLTQMEHYGTQLYTFQYYLVDVFAFIFLVVAVCIVLVASCIRISLRCTLAKFSGKLKKE